MCSKKQDNDIIFENIRKLLKSTEFASVDDNLKDMILDSLKNNHANEGKKNFGLIERLFGNHSKNITLYITFIILVLLIMVGLIYIFLSLKYTQTTGLEFWQIIGPIITCALGYIFGARSPKV